jgi:hypothetical protein
MAGSQHAAPGLAQEVVVIVDAEVGEQVVELGEEERDGPELAVALFFWEVRGFAAPELVVEDYGDRVRGC